MPKWYTMALTINWWKSGLSRVTAGPGKTFSRGPSREKYLFF